MHYEEKFLDVGKLVRHCLVNLHAARITIEDTTLFENNGRGRYYLQVQDTDDSITHYAYFDHDYDIVTLRAE